MTVAIKTNPKLWEAAKRAACSQAGLCKHSARKMQWATRYYKKKGGRYKGKKNASNSLSRWGKQKWRTSSGKKSRGKLRYLPSKSWKKLSNSQIRRTNTYKRKGYSKGRQYVRQPKDVVRTLSRRRKRTSKKSRRMSTSKKAMRRTRTSKKSRRKRTSKKMTRRTSKRGRR